MALKDDIIGDKGHSILRPDGTIVTTPARPGLIERMFPAVSHFAYQPTMVLAGIVSLGIAGWFAIHLWSKWRMRPRVIETPGQSG
jgi:hypothetical protein